MASKPELLIYSALRSLFTRSLPKGRWMLQRIETSTGTGIPDCYFSFMNNQMWIETKTTEYKVSNEQLNWAYANTLAGGLTYLVTRVGSSGSLIKEGALFDKPTSYSPLSMLCQQGIVSCNELVKSKKKGQEILIFLSFDDRMRDCSTLGVYLRRFNPDVLPVEDWVTTATLSNS